MKTQLLVCLALCSAITANAQKQRPNIVMIAVDDLNDWVGVYGGHPQIKTPNIDKLAQKSVVFRNASCPGPVCGPSRSALLSGFMPATTGAYDNSNYMLNSEIVQSHATLPEYFSKHDYVTISKGKIFHKHTTPNGIDHGQWAFDIWEQEGGQGKIQKDKYYSRRDGIVKGEKLENPLFTGGGGSDFAFGPIIEGKEVTKDYMTAKWFEQKLQEDYDKPFFMSVGISKPHLPFVVPEEFFNMYGLDTLIMPEYRMDDLDDIFGENNNQPTEDFLWCQHYGIHKEAVRAYMASITYADECVGVVLDALAKSKYADNTIVLLWGDHGWHLGEKLRFRKATLWRESTQLPFIMHVPGMKEMQYCNRNINLIDIYPTLIDLCNLPKKELDGKSIKPLLKNPTKKWTPTVTTYLKGNHSVITEKWHYIYRKNGVEELYNIDEDPMCFVNLVNKNTSETESIKKELRTYMPAINADELTDAKGDKSLRVQDPDLTIKEKRVLKELK